MGKRANDGRGKYLVGAAGEYLWTEAYYPPQSVDSGVLLHVGGPGDEL